MNNNQSKNLNTRERVLSAILDQGITMRPKFFFILKLIATFFVLAAIAVVSIFIINLVIFSIRVQGHNILFSFGPRGWLLFLQLFPWVFFGLDLILIFILEKLLRQFRFGYKSPVAFLFIGLVALVWISGAYLDRDLNFNDDLFERASRHSLVQPLNYLYQEMPSVDPDDQIIRGQISAVEAGHLKIVDSDDPQSSVFKVFIPNNNPYATTAGLKIGDQVFIASDNDLNSEESEAFGLHVLSSHELSRQHLDRDDSDEPDED